VVVAVPVAVALVGNGRRRGRGVLAWGLEMVRYAGQREGEEQGSRGKEEKAKRREA
jgi:hypothetical protein